MRSPRLTLSSGTVPTNWEEIKTKALAPPDISGSGDVGWSRKPATPSTGENSRWKKGGSEWGLSASHAHFGDQFDN